MILYHGSNAIVQIPEIRESKYNKDFYFGFYCTLFREQAIRWATRYSEKGFVNEYELTPLETSNLSIKKFNSMTEEWLDFIISCRSGRPHNFDIVEGPMANDTIFNYIQDFIDKRISRAAFWELARFKKPTHQMSFHSKEALKTLRFIKAEEVKDE